MIQVVGIGSAVFDTLMTTNNYPKEDSKLQGTATKFQCGGPCATALVAMSRLGIEAEYMGTVGDDMYGHFILDKLAMYGVKTENVRMIADEVSFHSFVLCNASNSSRTCIWNKGTVTPPGIQDVDLEVLKHAQYLHLDGHQLETAVYAAGQAHAYGVKVCLDAGGVYPGIERLLPYIDVLIPSEEFALNITKTNDVLQAAEILQETYHPQILIVTQGAKGGFIWEKGKEVRYPAFPVKAIDSNGAGDAFHGAFVAAQIKGMDVYESAKFASAASALKCTRFGAQEGIPGFQEVLQFIKDREDKER